MPHQNTPLTLLTTLTISEQVADNTRNNHEQVNNDGQANADHQVNDGGTDREMSDKGTKRKTNFLLYYFLKWWLSPFLHGVNGDVDDAFCAGIVRESSPEIPLPLYVIIRH
ncbi:hypothetical protein N7465_001692 [Penicillium sp. CMV-2018d]|nr:hypothetical protein N7465_001692 [Penicillium sp. CMV-2018d]